MRAEANLVVTPVVIETARSHVVKVREGFDELPGPLRSAISETSRGAGQFVGDLEVGLARFQLSWKAALGVCADSAGLIAANTGSAVLDVHAVDRSQTAELLL